VTIELFRVSQGGEGIDDADTIEGAREIARGQPTGRYDLDEIRADPFPSGYTSLSWCRIIRHPDERVDVSPVALNSRIPVVENLEGIKPWWTMAMS
jgi:hypothetical protein